MFAQKPINFKFRCAQMGSYIGTNFCFTMKKGCISSIEKATNKKKNTENTNIVRTEQKKPRNKSKEMEKESTIRRKRPQGFLWRKN